jgi:nucleotide-binding universal stress UspA family protein
MTDSREDEIVVGFSNSAASAAALRWAVAEGTRVGSRVRVLHVYDETEHADARLEASAADLPRIDAERVLGRLGNAARDARVTISQERGALEDTLTRAAAGARMLVIGEPGDCRLRGLDERLRATVTCPVVSVPLGSDRTAGDR